MRWRTTTPPPPRSWRIRRAAVERAPERLREIFLRLGRIHTQAVPDTKRAVGAYSRVLQLEPNNREALDALSLLYVRLGETRNALKITERLAKVETDKPRRAEYLVRLGQLAERAGDPRAAGQHLRNAVEEAPRDLAAVGELARFLERTRDVTGRRILLDRVASELRVAVHERPREARTWQDLATVLTWRGRTIAAQAAAELGELFVGAPRVAPTDTPARRLVGLANPAVDERTYPASVPSPLRQLFQLMGPVLVDGLKGELPRPALDRQARVTGDRPPRDVFAPLAVELGLPAFEVYVVPTTAATASLLDVVPTRPPVIVLSDQLARMGLVALRFVGAYTLRLASTQLHLALAGPESDFGALLAGIVRQYVPEYTLPDILEEAMAARAARIARLLSKRMRQDLMPFAMECSGPLDLHAARAGVREAAGRAGLLASGSIAAALAVLAAVRRVPADAGLVQDEEARALIGFALSDDYDDLVRLMA